MTRLIPTRGTYERLLSERTDRLVHGGRVREAPHPRNKETDFSMGRVRHSSHLKNDETYSITGCVRETTKPDERPDRFQRVRQTPHLPKGRDRFQHRMYKRDSQPVERSDRFQHGACKKNSPLTETTRQIPARRLGLSLIHI